MSATSTPRSHESTSSGTAMASGVAMFAGVMLAIVAFFQVIEGIAAVAEDQVYLVTVDYSYAFDVTTWGWIHIVLGVIGIATGIAILADQSWGRIAGITIAALAALANFAFLPYYPFWALVILSFNVLVIWALCTQMTNRAARF